MESSRSEARIECPHAPACPGCSGIGVPIGEQLATKRARVAADVAAYRAVATVAIDAVVSAASEAAYRTRAKLAVARGGRIGLFARSTHDVLDLPACRVLAPVVAEAVAALRALCAAPPRVADSLLRAEGDGIGRLRAVDVREIVDETGAAGVLVTLVVRSPVPNAAAIDAAYDALEARLPSLRCVAISEHDGRSPQLLGGAPRVVRGAALHRDVVCAGAPWVYAAPGGFAQANRAQAAAIHAVVEKAVVPSAGKRVLDVFAGSGALGLALAARGADVTMVEAFAPACEAALAAAREQGLADRVHAHAAPAEAEVERLAAHGARFAAAVVNPPRRGVAPKLREALATAVRDAVAYVSCEPATLARDLAHWAALGWRATAIMPFDMMPLTAEVECVAILRRSDPAPLVVLHEDATLLAVDKPPFVPTVPHPERAGSLLERVRTLPGAADAVPLHRLDAETSGVCLFAKSPPAASAWQRALADPAAEKRYVALVRGVGRAKGRIARPLREGGRLLYAATRYRRTEIVHGHALLDVALETGRTHQIRRHLASIGQPVLGDARHGHAASNRHLFERFFLDRPFLHCAAIEVAHPDAQERLRIESPLAPDLAAVLARLRDQPRPSSRARTSSSS